MWREIAREVLELFDPAAEENSVTLELSAGDRAPLFQEDVVPPLRQTNRHGASFMNDDILLDAPGCKSVVVGAAIDVDCLAGDEAAILGGQEQAGGGDLVDAALPAKRDTGGVRQMTLVPRRRTTISRPVLEEDIGRDSANPRCG